MNTAIRLIDAKVDRLVTDAENGKLPIASREQILDHYGFNPEELPEAIAYFQEKSRARILDLTVESFCLDILKLDSSPAPL